jgi:protein-disulfide isomerase
MEEEKSDLKEETKDKQRTEPNVWRTISVILLIALAISMYMNLSAKGTTVTFDQTNKQAVQTKTMNIINNNLVTVGTNVSLNSMNAKNGLWQMNLLLDNNLVTVYISQDGAYLFTNPIDLNNPPEPQTPTPTTINMNIGDAPVEGVASAPVTIIELSDFQCPYCGQFATTTYKQIKTDYIDTGKVKMAFINFPLTSIHANAQKAAEASLCANEQGKFWQMHDKMFANQDALAVVNLKGYAKTLGLNTTQFDSCLDTGKYVAKIQQGITDAEAQGITGTPAFVINGKLITGAQPYVEFKTMIDEELAK